jgi:predicted nucleotidyltransferase
MLLNQDKLGEQDDRELCAQRRRVLTRQRARHDARGFLRVKALTTQVPRELTSYLDELVARLADVANLHAVYLLGSAASGGYEHGRSDVDVVAVTTRSLSDTEKRELAKVAESLPCPARKLELVVYPLGSDRHEINLNTGEKVSFDPEEDPAFWFVLDRAIAEQHATVLAGPLWHEVFEPVPREAVLEALEQALDWQEENDPIGRSSVLNACRGWMWLETGVWGSKLEAAAWLRDRVRHRMAEDGT